MVADAAVDVPFERWALPVALLLAFATLLVIFLLQRLRSLRLQANMQRRLDEGERLKDLAVMAGGLAHEIRHPVSSVQFAVASARERLERLPDSADRTELDSILEGILGDVKRLEEITNAFLQYARPEAQPARDCDLAQAAEFVRRFLSVEARSRGVRIETDIDDGSASVRIPEVHLRQILINLVLNAVQASPDGGVVRLWIRSDGRHAAVDVEDEGSGVPEDAQARLFSPFFTTKSKGVGLGLALSRRLAREARGDVRYRPRGEDLPGSVFRLVLPCGPDENESTEKDPAGSASEPVPSEETHR